jgi:hypothetical protein
MTHMPSSNVLNRPREMHIQAPRYRAALLEARTLHLEVAAGRLPRREAMRHRHALTREWIELQDTLLAAISHDKAKDHLLWFGQALGARKNSLDDAAERMIYWEDYEEITATEAVGGVVIYRRRLITFAEPWRGPLDNIADRWGVYAPSAPIAPPRN